MKFLIVIWFVKIVISTAVYLINNIEEKKNRRIVKY
jgi:hypothetical protein